MASNKIISKSKFISGLQCKRLLWVAVNDKTRLGETNPATQRVFDQGHDVGHLAQQLFPDGLALTEDFAANLKQTRDMMNLRRPLFEAGFLAGRLFCRVDVLCPGAGDTWDIVEVKSSTEVKKENLHDVSFQCHVCRLAGLDINRVKIMHINNQYVRHGGLNLEELFITEDVTDSLSEYTAGIEEEIADMLECIDSGACPDGFIGRACDQPYSCALKPECWAVLPAQHVFTLNYGGKLAEDLLSRGITDIRDIPPDVRLSQKQHIQRDCALCGQPHLDAEGIRAFLETLEYPLYFLDFETFQAAVPPYESSWPYQQLPFQYSLHVLRGSGQEPEHYHYLHDRPEDPRPPLLAELGRVIGRTGSVLVYFQAFEEGRLKEAAEIYPEHQGWIDNVRARMVDLYAPFRGFLYYNPSQRGSASLKQVMPALTGIGYDQLEINEGGLASLKYLQMIADDLSAEERLEIRRNLLVYCAQDTGGMISMLQRLRELAAEQP